MKAILIILIFYAGESTHTHHIPMDSMRGCEAALVRIEQAVANKNRYSNKFLAAVCVEDR